MWRSSCLIVCVAFVSLFILAGCAKEYRANMSARKEIAWVQTTNQRMAAADVMNVVERILNPLERQAGSNFTEFLDIPVLQSSQAKIPSGDNYAMYLMSEMMGKFIEANGRAELMRARAQAINYMVPIIEAIYSQHLTDFGTPMSSNEVWSKLVGNIPFVATVGGMYALGAKGLDAAGDTISATVSGGSTLNTKSNSATHGGVIGSGNTQQGSTFTETTAVDKSTKTGEETPEGEE